MVALQNIQDNDKKIASASSSRTTIVASQYTSGVFSDAISAVCTNLNEGSSNAILSFDQFSSEVFIGLDKDTVERIEFVLQEMRNKFMELKEENFNLQESISTLSTKIKCMDFLVFY